MTTQQPDIERAAATILTCCNPRHPRLREWLRLITSDPSYATVFDVFADAYLADALYEQRAFATRDPFRDRMDELILMLGDAVVRFRLEGRPTGDVATDSPMVGTPITTGLAAAVAEYASDVRRLAMVLAPSYDTEGGDE